MIWVFGSSITKIAPLNHKSEPNKNNIKVEGSWRSLTLSPLPTHMQTFMLFFYYCRGGGLDCPWSRNHVAFPRSWISTPESGSDRWVRILTLTLPLLSTVHIIVPFVRGDVTVVTVSRRVHCLSDWPKRRESLAQAHKNMAKIWRTRRDFSDFGPFPNLASVPREFGVYLAITRRIKSVSKFGEDLASNSARIWRVTLLPRLGKNSAKIWRQCGDPCFWRETNTSNTQLFSTTLSLPPFLRFANLGLWHIRCSRLLKTFITA